MGFKKVIAINLRENKGEVGQANEHEVSSVPGEQGVQDISNALGKSKDNASKVRLVDVFPVGLSEQPGVHLQELGLTPQAGHSADVGDGLNSKLEQNCGLNLQRLEELLPLPTSRTPLFLQRRPH